jgi:hypothetical protein
LNLDGHPAPKCLHAYNDFQTLDYSKLQAWQHSINGINHWVFVAITHECDFIGLSLFDLTTIVFTSTMSLVFILLAAGASDVIPSEEEFDEYMDMLSLELMSIFCVTNIWSGNTSSSPINTHMCFSLSLSMFHGLSVSEHLTEMSEIKTNLVSISSWNSTVNSDSSSPLMHGLWSKGPLWHPGQIPNMKDGEIIKATTSSGRMSKGS